MNLHRAASSRLALAGAVLTFAAGSGAAETPGQALYARHCLSCHQADGGGVPNLQPAIAGGSWVLGDAQALAAYVLSGGFNSAERKDGAADNVMPEFRQLGDAELAQILTFIRARFGGGGAAVTSAQVAAARATLP